MARTEDETMARNDTFLLTTLAPKQNKKCLGCHDDEDGLRKDYVEAVKAEMHPRAARATSDQCLQTSKSSLQAFNLFKPPSPRISLQLHKSWTWEKGDSITTESISYGMNS